MITNWPDDVNATPTVQRLLAMLKDRGLEPIAVPTPSVIEVWFDNQEHELAAAVFGRFEFGAHSGVWLRGWVIEYRNPKIRFDCATAALDYMSKPEEAS